MSLPEIPPSLSATSYAGALGHAPADKRIDILRLIGQSGSISQAARDAGVSYKAAWQAIDTLTNLAGVALVQRAVGGAGGGGAHLTAAGTQLLAAAQRLDQARQQVLTSLQHEAAHGGPPGQVALAPMPNLSSLSMRTSMRNQLPVWVRGLQTRGQVVRVTLGLDRPALPGAAAAAGSANNASNASSAPLLVSRITLASAELLALHAGQAVLALCKATAVTVSRVSSTAPGSAPPSHATTQATNRLAGRATRVSRGETGDEVALTLDSGQQLVGFAPAASGIRVGSKVLASLDESAVVVAVAG